MRLIEAYLLFLGIIYAGSFLVGRSFPTSILFGEIIIGTRALAINLIILAVLAAIIYAFWKRKHYGYDLAIGWFGISALNAIFSIIFFKQTDFAIFYPFLLITSVLLIVVHGMIIWYILHEKKYFLQTRFHERPWQQKDKILVYTLITCWTLAILVGAIFAIYWVQHAKTLIDDTVEELTGMTYIETQDYCYGLVGERKDICLLVLAAKEPGAPASACQDITSDFYKFTCIRSISGTEAGQ